MIVYKLTSPSNKHYIGVTSKTLEERLRGHFTMAKNGSRYKIHTALRKYGISQFKTEILCVVDTKQELFEKEQHFIAKYNSYHDGYNLTVGGEGAIGYKPTDEDLFKNSQSHKRYYQTHPEARERLRQAQSLRTLSEDTRRKISESHIGKKKPYVSQTVRLRNLTNNPLKGKSWYKNLQTGMSKPFIPGTEPAGFIKGRIL